jgi:hypothetical protein
MSFSICSTQQLSDELEAWLACEENKNKLSKHAGQFVMISFKYGIIEFGPTKKSVINKVRKSFTRNKYSKERLLDPTVIIFVDFVSWPTS